MSQQPDLPPSYNESFQDSSLLAGEGGVRTTPAQEEDSASRDEKRPSLLGASEGSGGAGPSSSSSAPPEYTWYDQAGASFTLGAPWIFTNTGAPRYQLRQRLTHSGQPYQLRIRPLLATESRLLAANGASVGPSGSGTVPRRWVSDPIGRMVGLVPYDDDTSLYVVYSLGFIGGSLAEIHGLRPSRSLPGHILMERSIARAVVRGGGYRFWHMTRSRVRDTLLGENQRRMQRHGYHADEEWDRNLLFDVVGTNGFFGGASAWEWKDRQGRVVAAEEGRTLNLMTEMPQKRKDALTACWTAKAFMVSLLRFEEDVQASDS